jgi:hypothetical protein
MFSNQFRAWLEPTKMLPDEQVGRGEDVAGRPGEKPGSPTDAEGEEVSRPYGSEGIEFGTIN